MNVRFFGGTKAQYLSLATPRNPLGLYFCADTKELFWGDKLLTDGTRIVATEVDLPNLAQAADGITYFVEATRNGYVISPDRTKWIQVIHAPEGGDSVKAISFAGIELEEVDGVFTIDRRCAREALGFEVPEGMEDEEIEIVTKKYIDERLSEIPGADIDLSEYAKKEEIADFATEEFVLNKIAEAELNDKDIDISGLATKSELAQIEAKIPSTEGLASEQFVADRIAEIAIPKVPTNVSAFENDANYATEQFVAEAIANQVPVDELAKKEEVEGVKTKLETEILPVIEKAATEDWVRNQGYLTEHQSLEGYATEEFVNQKIAEAELADKDVDLSAYYTKSEVDALIPEVPTELYVIDFKAPNYSEAIAAYNSGKLLLLANAAPDVNSYAMMNYVSEKYITFTKFLMSRSETYGAFNTYYLRPDNTWEISDEVRLNKVEANVDANNADELIGITIGKDTYSFDNYATVNTVNEITQSIENIENTYVTNETLEQKNYVTEQYVTNNYITNETAAATYVTTENVTEVVETHVNEVVTKEIETKVETVIQEKVEAGEIIVNANAISYGEF